MNTLQFIIKSAIMVVGLTLVWLYIKYFKRLITEGHITKGVVPIEVKTPEAHENKDLLINVETSPCVVCKQTSKVTVWKTEYHAWFTGTSAQKAFPNLSIDKRELLISGTHPACWDQLFGKED